MISGISLSPKRQQLGLYYLLFFENIGQGAVCVFLREPWPKGMLPTAAQRMSMS